MAAQARRDRRGSTRRARRRLVGVALDVTDRKHEAEISATADQRLREAIEAISEAFVLWDASNRLVLCNSKYQRLHNLPAEIARPGAAYAEIAAMSSAPIVSERGAGQSDEPAPAPRRQDLRSPARRRALAAGQRTAHPRRRLRLRRHRHHRAEGARGAIDEVRAAAARDRHADCASRAVRSRRRRDELAELAERYQEQKARGGNGQPRQVRISRQHEPRAAHAAQRDHRFLADDGGARHSARSARRNIANIAPHILVQRPISALRHFSDVLDMSSLESGPHPAQLRRNSPRRRRSASAVRDVAADRARQEA